MPHHRLFCFFGLDQPCAPVPTAISGDAVQCSSPPLPEKYGISPFGIFVLRADLSAPGTLYLADGLEINFDDTASRPVLLRLVPPFSDHLQVPETFRVIGYNLGPGTLGVACAWDGEEARTGEYDPDLPLTVSRVPPAAPCNDSRPCALDSAAAAPDPHPPALAMPGPTRIDPADSATVRLLARPRRQSPGDDESEVLCQAPTSQGDSELYRPPGSYAYVRVSITGLNDEDDLSKFSREVAGAPKGQKPFGAR